MYQQDRSGAIRGYSPEQPQQGAVVYERYATSEQITTDPPRQYQQPQPVYQQPVYQQPQPMYQQPQPVERRGDGLAAFFKRRDVVLLISAIVCTVWLLISYTIIGDMLNAAPTGDSAEELGAALGTAIGAAMTIPFFVIAFIGQVFNWVAWLTSRRGFALTAAILYCVSLLFGFSYGLGIIPCVVLAFVGYARLKKRHAGQR